VLGVDFGTSNTVAVMAWPGGLVKPLLFDGSPLLPSAVCAAFQPQQAAAELLVGREAVHAARAHPECFEPNPKRCVDDGTVLLGGAEVPIVEVIAAVLRRVVAEAEQVAGTTGPVTLTCPAGWGTRRRQVLLDAAAAAGMAEPTLVAEPVAAASYFVKVVGSPVPEGRCAVVYDFGAGTFDASVVRRTAGGFDVLGSVGLPDVGGLDIDAAVIAYLGATYVDRADWPRLAHPESAADRRASRLLWEDVRMCKEMLSRGAATLLHVPLIEEDVPLGREQLEHLARPFLDRTVAATRAVVRAAGIEPGAIAGLFLVGGSSRIPLIATLLHRALGVVPTALEQPELVVAEGSLHTNGEPTAAAPPLPVDAPRLPVAAGTAPPPVDPPPLRADTGTAPLRADTGTAPLPADPGTAPLPADPGTAPLPVDAPAPAGTGSITAPSARWWRRRWAWVGALGTLAVVLVAAVAVVFLDDDDDPGGTLGGSSGTTSPARPGPPSPTPSPEPTDPVVGVWRLDGGSSGSDIRVDQVDRDENSYVGARLTALTGNNGCRWEAGTTIWRFSRSGSRYTGSELWSQSQESGPCNFRWSEEATFKFDGDELENCSTSPFSDKESCHTYRRVD
jgi:hypothetical protein